jgi:hypothetical protein
MNAPAGTAMMAPEVIATAQLIDAYGNGLARATPTCPMEHTSI